jgi:uncharacterized protein with PQ loop repeat
MQLIGQISLNISVSIYLIWFVPQIFVNFKRRNTQGLSFFMHSILCFGYLCDLLYGFGREMQWQYRLVTIIGLLSLLIQHYQFFKYGRHDLKQRRIYLLLSLIFLLMLGYILGAIKAKFHSGNFYDTAGMIANIAGIIYMWPQLRENYLYQSTVGLSLSFILLGAFLKSCDIISAYALDWAYPSKVGPIISLLGSVILLWQFYQYASAFPKTAK